MMPVKANTTYEVRCIVKDCRFVRTCEDKKEAHEIEQQHKGYHEQLKVGTKVLVPYFPYQRISKTGDPGRIISIFFSMEEAVVTLDKKRDCHECEKHPHQYVVTWRGKLSDLLPITSNAG